MKKALLIGAAYLLPVITSAQALTGIETLVQSIRRIVDILIPLVFALAILYFFWGLAQYILNSGDSAKQEEGRNKMIWGIVALFVMASVWGIVRFIGRALNVNEEGAPSVNNLIPRP